MSDAVLAKPKTIFYVDGYNWYHAIFKHKPEWKWLNIESFLKSLRPHEETVRIKLFSAMVDAYKKQRTEAFERQEIYFKALSTLPLIEIVLGTFQPRRVTCGGTCKEKYDVPEEKKTDVNIAIAMLQIRSMPMCSGFALSVAIRTFSLLLNGSLRIDRELR
jgi:hypothetical protein